MARVLVRVLFARRKGHEVRAIGVESGAEFLELASRSHSVIQSQCRIEAEKPSFFSFFSLPPCSRFSFRSARCSRSFSSPAATVSPALAPAPQRRRRAGIVERFEAVLTRIIRSAPRVFARRGPAVLCRGRPGLRPVALSLLEEKVVELNIVEPATHDRATPKTFSSRIQTAMGDRAACLRVRPTWKTAEVYQRPLTAARVPRRTSSK